jgi:hypothetical protein
MDAERHLHHRPKAYDGDAPPQLLVTNLTHAALAATHRVRHRAHPIRAALGPTARPPPFAEHQLSDAEHFAQLVLLAVDELAERLDDYAACVAADDDILDDAFPF